MMRCNVKKYIATLHGDNLKEEEEATIILHPSERLSCSNIIHRLYLQCTKQSTHQIKLIQNKRRNYPEIHTYLLSFLSLKVRFPS
jgi:Na+/phosphate symporter